MDFWIEFLAKLAAAGGLFWVVLKFAFDAQLKSIDAKLKLQAIDHDTKRKAELAEQAARFAEMQSKIDATLAVAGHAQNTVFSRYDEKRADAILKLEAAFSAFNWAVVTATHPSFDNTPSEIVFMTRAFELQELANDVIKIVGQHSFFFPHDFRIAVGESWYKKAHSLSMKAVEIGVQLSDDASFKTADDFAKSQMLLKAYQTGIEPIRVETHLARHALSYQLEQWFKDSTPITSPQSPI